MLDTQPAKLQKRNAGGANDSAASLDAPLSRDSSGTSEKRFAETDCVAEDAVNVEPVSGPGVHPYNETAK
jgi:hypothetical protein